MKDQLHFTIKEDKIYLKDGDRLVLVEDPLINIAIYDKYREKFDGYNNYLFKSGNEYTLTGYKVEIKRRCGIYGLDITTCVDCAGTCYNPEELAVISPIEPEEKSDIDYRNYRVIDYRVINNQIPLHECWGLKPGETKSDKPLLVKWTKIDAENYKYMNEVVKQNNDLKKELAEKDRVIDALRKINSDNKRISENENAELKKELDRAKQIISGKTFHDGLAQFKRNLKEKLLNEVCGTVDSYTYDKIITLIETL